MSAFRRSHPPISVRSVKRSKNGPSLAIAQPGSAARRLAAGEDPEMRAAVRHRDPEWLTLADGNVDAQRAGRLEQRVRVRLRDLHAERARGVRGVRDLANVDEGAERVRVLDDETRRAF